MNILFLDDDADRHQLFHSWLGRAQKQRSRARWVGLFRLATQQQDVEPARVQVAFTVEEATDLLRNSERFDVAFLDHDLEGRTFVEEREGTGAEVADFIASMEPQWRPRRLILHSHNPAGVHRMAETLNESGCNVEIYAFGWPAFARCLRAL